MSEPNIAAKKPVPVKVEAGKSYAWCLCGLSGKQPFCDGSHRTTEFRPLIWQAEQTEEIWFCQCKRTKKQPRCDGSHKTL